MTMMRILYKKFPPKSVSHFLAFLIKWQQQVEQASKREKKTLQRNRGLQTFALNENDAGTKHLVAARLPVLHLTIVY